MVLWRKFQLPVCDISRVDLGIWPLGLSSGKYEASMAEMEGEGEGEDFRSSYSGPIKISKLVTIEIDYHFSSIVDCLPVITPTCCCRLLHGD